MWPLSSLKKYMLFFLLTICVNTDVCGRWRREAGGPRAAEALPNLSWPYLPQFILVMRMVLHACVTCLTFLCNENSTCGISDTVDRSCRHCSLLILVCGATQIANSQTYGPKKWQMFLCWPFSGESQWQAELFKPALLDLSETKATFNGTSRPQLLKATKKSIAFVPWV